MMRKGVAHWTLEITGYTIDGDPSTGTVDELEIENIYHGFESIKNQWTPKELMELEDVLIKGLAERTKF